MIRAHIAAMQYGHISAGILSWWGQGTRRIRRIPKILDTTAGSSFRWAIYYEEESIGDPSVPEIRDDLLYLRTAIGSDPSYLRIDGRFVVFVYTDGADGCGMADRWSQANARINVYIVLRVFYRYRECAAQPDGWHQYRRRILPMSRVSTASRSVRVFASKARVTAWRATLSDGGGVSRI